MRNEVVKQKISNFFSQYPLRVYKKRSMLLRSNEARKQIFYLEKGHVSQQVITKEGIEIVLNIYKPQAFFPMAWVTGTFSNAYDFVAMDTVSVREAPFETVLAFIRSEPEVLFDLLQRVYRGLEGVLSQNEQLMAGNAANRLNCALLIAGRRFGKGAQNSVHITLNLTHQDLAAMTGLTRETVTRQISKLKKSGYIQYKNTSITITDILRFEKDLM